MLEDEYGENNDKVRFITLEFDCYGYARLTGLYLDYRDQMEKLLLQHNKDREESQIVELDNDTSHSRLDD